MFELDAPLNKERIPALANHFVAALLKYGENKIISGYMLVTVGVEKHTVSIVEWAKWKNKEDLRRFLSDGLGKGTFPFGVFSVERAEPPHSFKIGGALLDYLRAPKDELDALLTKTLDAYRDDFAKRWKALAHVQELTGMTPPYDNGNGDAPLLDWAREVGGYTGSSLSKREITEQLNDNPDICPLGRAALEAYLEVAV